MALSFRKFNVYNVLIQKLYLEALLKKRVHKYLDEEHVF